MSVKPGRNDPCLCGSGKKFKHCCIDKFINISFAGSPGLPSQEDLDRYKNFVENRDVSQGPAPSFNEFMGHPNAATDMLRELQKKMGPMEFKSLEEARSFMKQETLERNNAPLDDFQGLSPAIMHDFLGHSFEENKKYCTINPGLLPQDVDAAPVLRHCRYVLARIGADEKGLKATVKGNLPRTLVRDFYDTLIRPESKYPHTPAGEDDVREIRKIKFFLKDVGYIKYRNSRFSLTKKGVSVNEKFNAVEIYIQLFTYFMDTFFWLYGTAYPDSMEFLQYSRLFCLYLLGEKAKNYTSSDKLGSLYLSAFPHVAESYKSDYAVSSAISGFAYIFLEGFAEYLGLAESSHRGKGFKRESDYRITDLYKKLIKWKLDR